MDFACLRSYLGDPVRSGAREVMLDALVFLIPGAVMLIKFLLEMRVNRRTRRTFAEAVIAFGQANPPKWIGVLAKQLWNLYRLSLNQEIHEAFLNKFFFCNLSFF